MAETLFELAFDRGCAYARLKEGCLPGREQHEKSWESRECFVFIIIFSLLVERVQLVVYYLGREKPRISKEMNERDIKKHEYHRGIVYRNDI